MAVKQQPITDLHENMKSSKIALTPTIWHSAKRDTHKVAPVVQRLHQIRVRQMSKIAKKQKQKQKKEKHCTDSPPWAWVVILTV
ncbi:uncharacterized protein UTRI_05751 [Ustilago trichophora]|uniref:Uncharacterized protein n=1 Tax=Ustilago trichophora TaxID=86804 RepID=A0A5C3EKL2_9BASI|nr:uncharacterized protein UTRI_05751 [Ustilago trichophora]